MKHNIQSLVDRYAAATSLAAGFLFVCFEDRTICLAQRSKRDLNFPNTWATLGGGVKPGEEPIEAAKREVKEETGSLPEINRIINKYINQDDGFAYVTFVAELSLDEKNHWDPKLNRENEQVKWFSKLPHNLHPGLKKTLKAFAK